MFPYLEDTNRSKSYLLEEHVLIIMDTFKGQDNDTLKKLCDETNCDVVLVPRNVANKFKPLDLSVKKAVKLFIYNKYNDWFADQLFTQLQTGKDSADVEISSKLLDLKPINARWIFDWYNHVIKEKAMISRGFNSAGISEAVQKAEDIYEKIENPLRQ